MMLIDYKNVNIYHKDGEPVLQGVNFQVDEGEFVYVIGRVGSGKSSLLKSIYCELDVDEADEAMVLEQNLLTLKRKQIPELRKQMGIARAILNTPKMIIADEPTGNLDPETADSIIQLLRDISQKGTAVVMSTHNIPLLDRYPGRVYRCKGSEIEEVTDDYNKIEEIEN